MVKLNKIIRVILLQLKKKLEKQIHREKFDEILSKRLDYIQDWLDSRQLPTGCKPVACKSVE